MISIKDEYHLSDNLIDQWMVSHCNTKGSLEQYLIGNAVFSVVYTSEISRSRFRRSLEHLIVSGESEPQVTLRIIDYRGDRELFKENLPGDFLRIMDRNHNIQYDNRRFRMSYYEEEDLIHILNIQNWEGVVLCADMEKLPDWIIAFPFRDFVGWYAEFHRIQPVHGAAVGNLQGCALIAGRGGSGKSTLTISCMINGLKTAGDDFVLAGLDSKEVYSLYKVVKLEQHQSEEFPELSKYKDEDLSGRGDKVHYYPPTGNFLHKMPLKAGIIPVITGKEHTTFEKCSSEEFLKALLPSTLFILKGNNESIQKTKEIVAGLPCYKLLLGENYREFKGNIEKILLECQTN